MAIVVNMPRLSDTMEEGTVAAWLKKVGDKVEEGDILAEIETDKATMEFESFNEGTLLHIGVQEGGTTKVDELLAIIGDEGEDISGLLNGAGNASEEAKEEVEAPVETAQEETSDVELPEGVIVVTMPRLSDTMEEGTVATWLKKVGDTVEEGDILAEIETDKATMEFESFQSGTLLYVGLNEGDSAKVDDLLAIIGPAGTDVSNVASNFKVTSSTPKTEEAPKVETPKKVETKNETVVTSSAVEKSQPSVSTSNGRLYVSPLAKKLAEIEEITVDVFGEKKEGLKFTYEIREEANWPDGSPITGYDAEFYVKCNKNPKVDAMHIRPYFEALVAVEVDKVNPKKLSVIFQDKYFLARLFQNNCSSYKSFF